jgi:hypothetical protein
MKGEIPPVETIFGCGNEISESVTEADFKTDRPCIAGLNIGESFISKSNLMLTLEKNRKPIARPGPPPFII